MQKVISINLNGQAYHLEETGYEALRAYLDAAASQLKSNPDRAEIVADLEQAIAEKCSACLAPNKNVVSAPEVDRIIAEMGPVRDPEAASASTEGDKPAAEASQPAATGDAPKRLYQIREGALLTGVCNGLAAYFGIDVTIVRVVFVALAVLTKGVWALVYVALSFLVPFANTAEERAAAHGVAFSAQELVDRTKKQYRQQQREWRRQWRRASRRRFWGPQGMPPQAGYAGQVWARAAAPLFGLLQAAAFVVLVLAIISFVNSNTVFGWPVPKTIPLWAGILILVILFQVVTAPLHALRYSLHYGLQAPQRPPQDVLSGLVSLVALAFGFWLLYQYVPQVREFVRALPAISHEIWESLSGAR